MESTEDECDICGDTDHPAANCPEIQSQRDSSSLSPPLTLARQTLPSTFALVDGSGYCDVVCKETVATRTRFGPLVAKCSSISFPSVADRLELELLSRDGSRLYMDLSNENECNWLCLVRPAAHPQQQNCMVYQLEHQVYISTTRQVEVGEVLRVWYARGYAKKLGKPLTPGTELGQVLEQTSDRLVNQSSADNLTREQAPSTVSDCIDQSIVVSQSLHEDDVQELQMLECQFLYTCPTCGDVTCNNQQELDTHMLTMHGESEGLLKVQNTLDQSVLEQHSLDQHPLEQIGLQCKQCPYIADSISTLALHITSAHLDEEISSAAAASLSVGVKKRVWACTSCGVVFSNPRSLGIHKKMHHPVPVEQPAEQEGPQPSSPAGDDDGLSVVNVVIERQVAESSNPPSIRYGRGLRKKNKPKHLIGSVVDVDGIHDCPHCSDMLSSATVLSAHINNCHSFVCDKCELKFVTDDGLKKHACRNEMLSIDISLYHSIGAGGESQYTCLCCQLSFTDVKEFHSHLIFQGTNLQCEVCKGYCTSTEDLEAHVISCTGPATNISNDDGTLSLAQSHLCHQCNLMLVDEESLQAHTLIHTHYKCNACDAQYYSRYGLQKHLLRCDQSQLTRVRPVFACLQCNSVYATQHGLEHHNKQHTEPTFDCRDCLRGYKTQADYEDHDCHATDANFSCDICGDKFKTNKGLACHYLKHTMKFDCLLCQKTFDKKDDLIKHSLECSAKDMLDKTGRIDCAHCQESFTEPEAYKAHLDVHTHHYECTHCRRRFRRKPQLAQHLAKCRQRPYKREKKPKSSVLYSTTASEVHYTCPICSKMFVRKDYYLNHTCRGIDGRVIERADNVQLITEPDRGANVVCYQCGKIFTSQSNLTKHLKLHGEKNNTCEICGKAFYQLHAMKLHYDSVHTDKLKVSCDQCNRIFRNKYSLNQHRKQFHSANATFYACEVCGKKFLQKGNMLKHMLAHDGSRPYQCEYCAKNFKYPEQMKRHSILHTHGKTFECHICERRFLLQYELNKHLKEMHTNKVFTCGFCNENCKWKHTMRRHIKRRHPQFAEMADNTEYLMSLQKEMTDPQQMHLTKLQTELSSQSNAAPLVISMDSLTAEQIVELAEEQIVGHVNDEGLTIHLYNEHGGEPQSADGLQKLAESIQQQQQPQQQVMINNQHFAVSIANGQAILTQVDIDDSRGTSILRNHTAGDEHVTELQEQDVTQTVQVVGSEETHQEVQCTSLPETTVLQLTSDGSIAYSSEPRQQLETGAVSFTDIGHMSDNPQDDSNKMMFFNILTSNHESPSAAQ